MLFRSDNSPVNQPLPSGLPLSDLDAIQFGIQQSMNQLNQENAALSGTQTSVPDDNNGILNWDWRNSLDNLMNIGVKPASASYPSINDIAPRNYPDYSNVAANLPITGRNATDMRLFGNALENTVNQLNQADNTG